MGIRGRWIAALVAVIAFLVWMVWHLHAGANGAVASRGPTDHASSQPVTPEGSGGSGGDTTSTTVYAHNLRLRRGPEFQVYVRWLRGEMVPAHAGKILSLDDQESFIFAIDKGVVRVALDDINKLLNSGMTQGAPLKNMALSGSGSEMELTGTMHKLLVPLPVKLQGTLSAMPDGRIHLHVEKISVLKMPVKGLMSGLHLNIKDIAGSSPVKGMEISGDDVYLDNSTLLPPPHIRGKLTSISIQPPDVMVIFGNAPNDEAELAQWHNFLRFKGGVVSFGKLTMQDTDLTLIDASDDSWFDLDLANYQKQLVQGYSRVTPEGGLEMFMPGVGQKMPAAAIPLETLKDKNRPLPGAAAAAAAKK